MLTDSSLHLTLVNSRPSLSEISNVETPADIVDSKAFLSSFSPTTSLSEIGFNLSEKPFAIWIEHPLYGKVMDTRGHSLLAYDKYL